MKWQTEKKNHTYVATLDDTTHTEFTLRRFSKEEQRLFETNEWYLWFRIGKKSYEVSYPARNKRSAIESANEYIVENFARWIKL